MKHIREIERRIVKLSPIGWSWRIIQGQREHYKLWLSHNGRTYIVSISSSPRDADECITHVMQNVRRVIRSATQ